jgi:hypothetical protein
MFWRNKYERAISGWNERQEKKQIIKDWKDRSDPIRIEIYSILPILKLFLVALIVYLFVLTISEGTFFIQNFDPKAVGETPYKQKGYVTCQSNPESINLYRKTSAYWLN